jgi:hypothetical protein
MQKMDVDAGKMAVAALRAATRKLQLRLRTLG